jgi:hypothetical protein
MEENGNCVIVHGERIISSKKKKKSCNACLKLSVINKKKTRFFLMLAKCIAYESFRACVGGDSLSCFTFFPHLCFCFDIKERQ